MRDFDEIWRIAADRKGGDEALEALLEKPKPRGELEKIAPGKWLSTLSQVIFSTGLSHKMVANKWPGIEAAFWDFDLGRCALLSDDDLDALLANKAIIRHAPKILAVRDNAAMLLSIVKDHGNIGAFFTDWPSDDFIGLVDYLKTNGSRLGGTSGAYSLRRMGVDGFILTRDVVARLVVEGVIDKEPTSKAARKAVQEAFNHWGTQSGRSLMEISRVLAMSVG